MGMIKKKDMGRRLYREIEESSEKKMKLKNYIRAGGGNFARKKKGPSNN